MELQKAKKFVIVLLVILNACLAVLNYQQNRESAMNASQEKAIFEVLSKNGITMYTDLITETEPMSRLACMVPTYTKEDLERTFFDGEKTTVVPSQTTTVYRTSTSELTVEGPHGTLTFPQVAKEKGQLSRGDALKIAEEYMDGCKLLRKYFDHPALTTDVIVGFPGETQEEFAASKAFVDQVDFYETHVFKYSRRQGTKAAAMENQVPEPEKTRRSNELLALNRKKQKDYEERLIGTTQEVLMEEAVQIDGETWQVGHTKEYVKIGRKTEENLTNQLVNVEIESHLQIIH